MNTKQPALALTIACVCAGGVFRAHAGPASDPDFATEKYRYVVSVGCAPPDGHSVAYVWHTNVVPEPEGERIFKQLAAPDFEDCLSEIAMTAGDLYESLLNLGPHSGQDVTRQITEEATNTWSRFGVYQAIDEVATTGTRGAKVGALLAACEHLRRSRGETKAAR